MAVSTIKKAPILRNFEVVVDDYFQSGTSGQTHDYTLKSGAIYMLFCGKINGAGSGVYFVSAFDALTSVSKIVDSSAITVTANGLTLSVTIDVVYVRVCLIKISG